MQHIEHVLKCSRAMFCRKGDLYVHADLHGAASTIIKNGDASKPVPPLSIQQACVLFGLLCLAHMLPQTSAVLSLGD